MITRRIWILLRRAARVRVRAPAVPRVREAARVRGPVPARLRGQATLLLLLGHEALHSAALHFLKCATACLKHGFGTDRNGSTFLIAALSGLDSFLNGLDTLAEFASGDLATSLLLLEFDHLVSFAFPPLNHRRTRL